VVVACSKTGFLLLPQVSLCMQQIGGTLGRSSLSTISDLEGFGKQGAALSLFSFYLGGNTWEGVLEGQELSGVTLQGFF